MTRPLRIDGAAVVVTGGGSGIGRAAAMAFSARGALVAVSDLSADRADAVASEIGAAGGTAFGLSADVTDEAQLVGLRDACLARYGHLEVVMNNVGVLALGPPESLPDEAWERVFDINVFSI